MQDDPQTTVLVTGGCGFVMSNVITNLLAAYPDAKVVSLDINPTDRLTQEFLDPSVIALLTSKPMYGNPVALALYRLIDQPPFESHIVGNVRTFCYELRVMPHYVLNETASGL